MPAALPVLLEPARHRRRDVPPRARDRALAARVRRGARARRPAARAHRRRADAAPRSRRAVRRRARRRPVLVAHHRRDAVHARARAGAEGGRARPRADLDPEPGRRGQRPHRGQPVVREEDRGGAPREGARLPADDQLRPAPAEPRSHRGAARADARSRRAAARARQHAVLRLGGPQPGGADAVAGAARARGGGGPALPRARRPQGRRPLGAPRLLRGAAEAVHGRLGPDGDGGRAERRRAALPGGVDDSGARVRQRPRPFAGVDLERVRRVRALPRDGLDAGAVPDVPARPPGGGLRRLPLPGAAARGRRGGDRSGLPVLAPSRPRRRGARAGADRRVRLSHDEAAAAPNWVRARARAARPARCGATRAPTRAPRRP